MFVCFETTIENKNMFKYYYDSGKTIFDKQKNKIQKSLEEYIMDNKIILDGDSISNNWFPEINFNIFISHSHLDEKYVIAFAGWLKENFGLTSFINSCIWGYSNELLRNIDNKYCKNDYVHTYSYEKRNVSTSHVHMMLNVALMKMIDKCECVFFVNTPNSIPIIDNINNTESTLSPWIYSEVEMTRYLREQEPNRKGYKENFVFEFAELKIKYKINKEHMIPINDDSLKIWLESKSRQENPLDTLYKQVKKIEADEKVLNG